MRAAGPIGWVPFVNSPSSPAYLTHRVDMVLPDQPGQPHLRMETIRAADHDILAVSVIQLSYHS
jgi:hypothetical protein